MTFLRSLEAVASASGSEAIDWSAVSEAATAAISPGSLAIDATERRSFADDVRVASREIGAAADLAVDPPRTIEVINRHHWIDANVTTFERVLAPLDSQPMVLPGLARRLNTASMATMLSFLGRKVLGQYDPLLFGDGEPQLYIVLPNLRAAAASLDVDYDRFRRWIVFHEVAHAVEFDAAPWLAGHLEEQVTRAVSAFADGRLDTGALRHIDATMTAVEGYAEFVMDQAFDDTSDDLRAKLDARRRAGGPVAFIVRRMLGLGLKRRQYERGRRFFDDVAAARGAHATAAVWRAPEALPTASEISHPARWIDRVDP